MRIAFTPLDQARRGALRLLGVVGLVLLVAAATATRFAAAAPLSNEEAGNLIVASAQRAYQARNYPLAIDRFRAFLKDYGGHREASAARLGLGVCLIEGPPRDLVAAVDLLNQAASANDFPQRAFAEYYAGVAQRGLGLELLAQAAAKPPEATTLLEQAHLRWEAAARRFATAGAQFLARAPTPPTPDMKTLPVDYEWAVRAHCDQAEMLLRLEKYPEAAALVEPLLENRLTANSAYRNLALYYLGQARFEMQDYLGAGRALSQLAPFRDPAFGTHAQYLLARVHHLADEHPEAAAQYEGLLSSYDANKQAAQQALQHPAALKDQPAELARLTALVKAPPPDYVARSAYFLGVLAYEDGKFAEAAARFTGLVRQYPKFPLVPEVRLRLGVAQTQLKQYAEALKNLQPLTEHATYGEQATRWIAKAEWGAADPAKPAAYEAALRAAAEHFRKAADKAEQRIAAEPAAKQRRGDILLELADTLVLAKQYNEAAGVYEQVVRDKPAADHVEEALQRQATAVHLAGQFAESEILCQRFLETYPKSTLASAVVFRRAENAAGLAAAAVKAKVAAVEANKLSDESARRYAELVANYPDAPQVNLARQSIGLVHYRQGRYEACAKALGDVPDGERTGQLANVSYLLADCQIRLLPTDVSDAFAAGRLLQQLEEPIKQLQNFVGANANDPLAPDALFKLGQCYQQLAAQQADPPERAKSLAAARQTYDQFLQKFAKHPLQSVVLFETANLQVLAGNVGGAIKELHKFQHDPLRSSAVAPLALVRLAALLRAQNRAADALKTITQCRDQYEATLAADPARQQWLPVIQYQHALLLKETGKLPEAATLFEQVATQFAAQPEGVEAAWRWGQCRREEQATKLNAARQQLAQPNLKPEQVSAASELRAQAMKGLKDAADYLQKLALAQAEKSPGAESHLRLIYESAWCCRLLGEAELDAACEAEAQKIRQAVAAHQPARRAADLPPAGTGEQLAWQRYAALIAANDDAPQSVDARLELAEMLAFRNEHVKALALLNAAAQKDVAPDLSEKIQLRLGYSLLATGDAAGAVERFESVQRNAKSPLLPQAQYLLGEAACRRQDWAKATAMLAPFRDQQPFGNLPGISDRALLRLGAAQAEQQQHEASRQSLEALVNRFPNSDMIDDARFALAALFQQQKQPDQAVKLYSQIIQHTAAEVAAKAQLQTGICRLEQNRPAEALAALQSVPLTYGYPDTSAAAMCQAAKAHVELHQADEAVKVLNQVLAQYADSPWAAVARQQLDELKK